MHPCLRNTPQKFKILGLKFHTKLPSGPFQIKLEPKQHRIKNPIFNTHLPCTIVTQHYTISFSRCQVWKNVRFISSALQSKDLA